MGASLSVCVCVGGGGKNSSLEAGTESHHLCNSSTVSVLPG